MSKNRSFNRSKVAFGEVLESTLSNINGQSWQWNVFPRFGGLVQVLHNDLILFGIVTSITTGSMDPQRYPFAYQKTEEELMAEQPQIFELLKTTFTATIIGYQQNNTIYYVIPSKPCKIHSFIQHASAETVQNVLCQSDFLHLLFARNQSYNLDELLLAIIKELSNLKILKKSLLEELLATFSFLTSNDYHRLRLFLSRVQKLCMS